MQQLRCATKTTMLSPSRVGGAAAMLDSSAGTPRVESDSFAFMVLYSGSRPNATLGTAEQRGAESDWSQVP